MAGKRFLSLPSATRLFGNLRKSRILHVHRKHTDTHFQLNRRKATAAVLKEDQNTESGFDAPGRPKVDPSYEKIDLSFENAKESYKSKTNLEILRALFVFNLCSFKSIVHNNKKLMKLSRNILGARLFQKLMKATFYGQFVAGADVATIRPVVEKYRTFGVKAILDYSVEKDLSKEEAQKAEMAGCSPTNEVPTSDAHTLEQFRAHKEFGDRREDVTSARTYFYEDEHHCDENMQTFINSINCVSGATNATGFAAIKLTALGRPQLLLQVSEVLTRVRRYFEDLTRAAGSEGIIERKAFEKHLKSFNIDREERKRWFTILDVTNDGVIDLLDWHNLLEVNMSLAKLLRVPNLETGELDLLASLTGEEEQQMRNMLHRINTIMEHGQKMDVRVMVDAEQTYFQPAINRLTTEMMRTFNKEKAIVFNTYQCYLKDAYDMITTDLALSEREDFYFGAKLVRGAYMDQERKRAVTLGYEDPINPTFEATTAMYEKVLLEVLDNVTQREKGKIAVMVASHNEDTVRFTIQKLHEYGIHAQDRIICFGQLFGMCDQVSFALGQAGYSVYKYVPYGPVEEVLPYLSRRAVENSGVISKVQKEMKMLKSEYLRRLRNREWFYKVPEQVIKQA